MIGSVHLVNLTDVRNHLSLTQINGLRLTLIDLLIYLNYVPGLEIPMIYASSSNVHNNWKNPYASSKKAMEAVAKATNKHIGLRFTNVFMTDADLVC